MSNKKTTPAQSFFSGKIFPHLDEIYNYSLLVNGDERIAEKQLLSTCKEASWFSEYLSPETGIRIWLLRIMMKIVESNSSDDTDSPYNSLTEQNIDLSKFDKDCIEHKGQYETTKRIKETISKLPYKLRQPIVLIDHLQFSSEQAADLIDTPEGTVLARLYDARKLLLINLTSGLSTVSLDAKPGIKYEDKKTIVSLIDKNNPPDKNNFENEVETQQYVKSLFEKYIVHQSIRPAITEKIIYKFAPDLKDKIDNGNSSGGKRLITGATILMIIVAAVLIIFYRPDIANPEELVKKQQGKNNVLVQLEKNYNLLLEHKFDSLKVNIQTGIIDQQLNEAAPEYKPVFLIINGWYPKEYFITDYDNVKFINLIYQNDKNKILYTYQVPLNLIGKGKSFKLSDDLLNYLNSENCFVTGNGGTTFLLKIMSGNILGVAAHNPDKELLAGICNQKPL